MKSAKKKLKRYHSPSHDMDFQYVSEIRRAFKEIPHTIYRHPFPKPFVHEGIAIIKRY